MILRTRGIAVKYWYHTFLFLPTFCFRQFEKCKIEMSSCPAKCDAITMTSSTQCNAVEDKTCMMDKDERHFAKYSMPKP